MQAQLFERYRRLIYQKSGIVLSQDKHSLLVSRLQKRLRHVGVANETEYFQLIEADASGSELIELLNAISTNTTFFWREPDHFSVYSELLRRMLREGRSNVKVWCAAASYGQEPYTLAMKAAEVSYGTSMNVQILATDVSTRALQAAARGEYERSDVEKLPSELQRRFFHPNGEHNALTLSVTPEIRGLVLFKRLNLIEFPYPLRGPIDIIFCRNVLIYFDTETRERIVAEMTRLLAPGGHLFLSLSENLLGIQHVLEKAGNSVFRKR